MAKYDFTAIEAKWQAYWDAQATFQTPNPGQPGFEDAPKLYVLDMFPYPSGAGLHVGHPEGYTATDIVCRYARHRGFNVLHPMGYDAFGLPAEQYAVEHGVHPRETTATNIANIERQIKMFGFSYDWSRRVETIDPAYYHWTQWIFLQLYGSWFDPEANAARPIEELVRKLEAGTFQVGPDGELIVPTPYDALPEMIVGQHDGAVRFAELSATEQRALVDSYRLAYVDEVPVNWCPKLGTVLANEEVTNDGRSERGDHPVYRRAMKQWMLRITHYAERLEDDLSLLDWPEPVKLMQRNWIGKSVGAEVDFSIAGHEDETVRVYTTRPDTLFGSTYMVLAPEHPMVDVITTDAQRVEVEDYVRQASQKTEMERTADTQEKTGVFTGAMAINPVSGEEIPVFAADYVMINYGTGAIMAVPAHDHRDWEFAVKFGLPIRAILKRRDEIGPRYTAQFHHDDFERMYNLYRADPARYPEICGIDFGPVTHQDSPRDFVPNEGDDRLLYANRDPKRWIYVGPDGLDGLIGDSGVRDIDLAVPVCEVTLSDELAYIESGLLDGLSPSEGKTAMIAHLEAEGLGKGAVNYKLRDWLFSRQRYWGEPFPIIHCDGCGTVTVPEDQLPLELPPMEDFSPVMSDDPNTPPTPPLAKVTDWVKTTCPTCGGPAQRELNTMPQWAGSCWYYLRYLDPTNPDRFCDETVERYWMAPSDRNPAGGVDLYVGGAEHAVLHLLYARFWHKVLFDLGHVSTPEPFGKLFNQGMIRSFAYRDERGVYIGYDDVDLSGDHPVHRETGERLSQNVEKMSKSLKNVVNPDEVIAEYGADTFRLYEMFMGPLEASKPWNTQDVPGVFRFLQRVWRMVAGDEDMASLVGDQPANEDLERQLHKLIQKVGDDIEAMKFNTAIAAMMEFVNAAFKISSITVDQALRFILLLSPFAPHLAEELWQGLGGEATLAYEPWPTYDEAMLASESVELPVQINGKVRSRIAVPTDADQEAILAIALADEKIADLLAGKNVIKKIVVPGRLVNLVAK
jgi:leucyl-tRNA synthetase